MQLVFVDAQAINECPEIRLAETKQNGLLYRAILFEDIGDDYESDEDDEDDLSRFAVVRVSEPVYMPA